MKIDIFNVGQGDAILLTWRSEGLLKVGIIDCNKFDGENKIISFLKQNSLRQIDFIVLSHFHYDHFSGFSDIFDYCINQNIEIKLFLHTFASQVLDIYNQIFYSKKVENEINKFISSFEKLNVKDHVLVDCYTRSIQLTDDISMSFLAPQGNVYLEIAKKIHQRNNEITCSNADINKLSTIIKIRQGSDCVLLTSDATKKSFVKIRGLIKENLLLGQIPHHGSFYNIDDPFWKDIKYDKDCPIFVSVGDEPKDKLPDKKSIEYFDKLGFHICSTNNVYGISEYFFNGNPKKENSSLDLFSTKVKTQIVLANDGNQFEGDKSFSVFK